MDDKHGKYLSFMRHAKSSWRYPELHDYDRPLNERGLADAPIMGRKLKKMGISPDMILCSPANRAISTARIICDKINFSLHKLKLDDKIYTATSWQMLDIIKAIDNKYESILVIGHEPMISQTIEILTGVSIEKFPTCAFLQMELSISKWSEIIAESGLIKTFEYPKKK